MSHSNRQMVDCGCCHFTKYANRKGDFDSDCTIGEYIDSTWPNCPCGKKNCSTYQTFISASHRISNIPVKRYFCPCISPDYYHLEWKDQRSYHRTSSQKFEDRDERKRRSERSRSPSRSSRREAGKQVDQQVDQVEEIKETPDFRDHLISQLQQQILVLQRDIQLRDFYIQQTSFLPNSSKE